MFALGCINGHEFTNYYRYIIHKYGNCFAVRTTVTRSLNLSLKRKRAHYRTPEDSVNAIEVDQMTTALQGHDMHF